MNIENYWIYDIETYRDCFTFTIIRADGKFLRSFEISKRKSEIEKLLNCLRYLRSNNQLMVGFNNIGFDYPIIHEIMLKAISAKKNNTLLNISAKDIFNLAQKQINSFKGEGFGNTIRDKDVLIKQVDLYKIHHFDNKARSTSLKMLEFNMRSESIEDLPFEIEKELTTEDMDVLIHYNQHDVKQTLKFFNHSLKAIEFREELSIKLGKDFTNANDTKVGKDYFIMKLEKAMPGSCYKQQRYGRKVQQTKRDFVDLGECLFDYYDFKRPEFQAVMKWFEEQQITETKGVFTDIPEHHLGEVAKYATLRTKRQKFWGKPTEKMVAEFKQEFPEGWVNRTELKSGGISYWKHWNVADTLNVVLDGFQFDFGVGGLHGSVESKVLTANEKYDIIDCDVSSMYPNIAISNRTFPEHLSEKFCDIYEDLYNERKKHPKGSPENALMKLALNGVYGDSNNQYSPFYDPKYTMTITINGQLSLCLLAEKLLEIEGLTLIQVNTDGITVKCPKDKREEYMLMCTEWEARTKLNLEYADYSKMFIRDVNNYVAVYTDGNIKRKGAYEYENLGWHQNQSALVVKKAVEAKMLHGEDVSDFILSCKDKYDFLLRTKVPRSSKLVLVKNDTDTPLQNICRYYACENGGKLVKIMPPLKGKIEHRRIGIDKEYNMKPCNDIRDFSWDINYDYYINEAKKLVIKE